MVVASRIAMPDNVDKLTPVASSPAGNVTSSSAPPVSSVPSVPSSDVAGPSNAHVAPPSSSAADAMMSSLVDTVRARAPVASVAALIIPSTPSEYNRYTGTVIGNVNEVVGSEPEELLGSLELVMPRRDSRCLVRTVWSLRARGSFHWDDIVASSRADVKRVRDLANFVGTAGVTCTERYMDYVRGAYQIPSWVRCDRLFLVDASDAKYVELVERYLFYPTRPYPGFCDRTSRDALVRTEAIRLRKTSYSLMCGTSVSISFRHYSVRRGPLTREYEVNMGTRAANRTSLMILWSRFPLMPVEVLFAMPPQGLSVRLPRVAYYFSLRVRDESNEVRIRYDAAFMIDWAHSVANALKLEIENTRRVWTCSDECIAFLSRVESLEDFYVDSVGDFVSCVSFRSLVGQLRRVRMLPLSSLVSRLDDLSRATVTWAIVNAVDGSIVPTPATTDFRETRTPRSIASPVTSLSSRSPLDAVIPDEQLRTEPLWAAVFVNEAVRVSGWRVRDVIESSVNRAGASESRVKKLSSELTEAKHGLKISDVKRDSLREEIDRILSRNRGDGERDVAPRWTARRYRDDYDNEEDVRDRDTRDRDYDPYESDRVRRVAEGKLRRLDSRFDTDRSRGDGERDDRYRDDDYYRGGPSGGGVSR